VNWSADLSTNTVSADANHRVQAAGSYAVRFVRAASLALALLIFGLISLGGLVRNAGAGLSCPDWPLCYGKVVPPMDMQVFLEWFHRLIAGSVSVLLLSISAIVFAKADLRKRLGTYAASGLALLAAQIVLGGLTVLGLLDPKWVSSHLAVGIAFFGTMVLLALEARECTSPRKTKSSLLSTGATVVLTVVYLQIILGGVVSSNYAGLACPDFPTCYGQWIPELTGLVKLQFMHRVGALVATIGVLSLVVALRSKKKTLWLGLTGLLLVQLALGIGSVFMKLPLLMSVAHLAVGTALFGTLVVTRYETRRS